MNNNNSYLATAGVDLNIKIDITTAIYIIIIVALSAAAFFTAKKFLQ